MSVKPGTKSKKTLSKANGISGGVGSETMNPPTPLPYGWTMDSTNYATVYTDASSL